jgi:hypothetical protein
VKKLFGLFLVIGIVVGAVPYARSLGTPPSPPDIAAKRWIAMGDGAGFVITLGDSISGAAKLTPGTVKGYFMVRQGNTWLRVDSQPETQAYPAALAH